MYKPLHDLLTIKNSGINGLGLFAKKYIDRGTNLGMSHLKLGDKILRTPLGGFINHSNKPNCVKSELRYINEDAPKLKFEYQKWNLIVIEDVKGGEELTCKYTFYKIDG